MSFTETLQGLTGKPLADCTNQELYLALLELVRQKSADRVQPVTGRKLTFKVTLADEKGPVGGGTHERFVIFEEKFAAKAEAKKG